MAYFGMNETLQLDITNQFSMVVTSQTSLLLLSITKQVIALLN